jgi:hypothetical protein
MRSLHRLVLAVMLVLTALAPQAGLIEPASASTPTSYMLDNGKIRFGGSGGNNGSSADVNTNSITNSGMPAQPYYKAANGLWYKLTFSDAPLSMTVGSGTGSNWTGSNVPTSGNFDSGRLGLIALDGRTVTASNWTERRNASGISVGYGALTVEGTASVNNQQLGIRHTIELGATDSFVRITTRLTNNDAAVAQNVHLWVGTRDDWVGTSDRPTKTRGNLVDGAFTAISAPTDTSDAIRITSGAEGVLFYSTTDGANTSHAGCCNFSNTYTRDPNLAPVATTGDGSYALYLPVGDLAAGASTEIVWFYAAGATADLDEVAQAVAAAAGSTSIGARTDTSATIDYESSEAGTVYYLLVPRDSQPPTPAQVKAGVDYDGITRVAAGSATGVAADAVISTTITSLTPTTSYDLYFVTEFTTADGPELTPVARARFTTVPGAPTGVVPSLVGDDVRLSFTPGAGTVTGYEYSTDGGTTWTATGTASVPDAGQPNVSRVSLPSFTLGGAFDIQLRAVNGSDGGVASSTVSFVIPEVTITQRADTTVDLTITAPTNSDLFYVLVPDGSDIPTPAEIKAGGDYGTVIVITGATGTATAATAQPINLTGLDATTTYDLHTILTDSAATTDSLIRSIAFTTVPGAPTGVVPSLVGDDVRLSFTPGAGTVTGYEYSTDGGTTWTATGTASVPDAGQPNVSRVSLPSFTLGGAFDIQLRAVNGSDGGVASSTVSFVIPEVTITQRADTTVDLTITAPTNSDLFYVLVPDGSDIPTPAEIKAGGDYGTVIVITGATGTATAATAQPINLTGLDATTTYDLHTILTDSAATTDSLIRSIAFTTVPGAPTITSVTPATRRLDVVITPGGGSIANYETAVSNDNGANWSAWAARSPASDASAITIGGLDPGDCYLVKLRAISGVDRSAETATVTEACVPAELPGTPTGVTITPLDEALRLSFMAPAATGDARGGLTDIEFRLDGGMWRSVGALNTVFEVIDLENGKSYSIELRAVNSLGAGGASTPATGAPGIPAASAVDLMLDNGRLRFGGGGHGVTTFDTVRSISESGMLRQPFYRAENGRWYRLTFSDAPLSLAIGTGTSGSNWTGSTVATGGNFDNGRTGLVSVDNLAHSSTGWNELRLDGTISAGYGTIVVTGDTRVNGADFSIQQTYALGADDSFVEVTTKLTNDSGATAQNVNVWVGTRDDWVATSDRPTKTRGNLVGTEFTPITDPTQTAPALQITSGGHGIFFYSTTAGANTVHASCCSFSNSVNRDPDLAPIATTGDGSYGIHLPAGDIAAGASVELVWYYAAGSTADLVSAVREVAERPTPTSAIVPEGPVLRPIGLPAPTRRAPVALIGDDIVQVSALPAGTIRQSGAETLSTATIVNAGSIAIAVDVSGAGQVRTTAGSAPEVSVIRDRVARTSGGGLLPGSEVRAWLPTLGRSAARALASLPVAEDGTFTGELPFDGRTDRQTDGRPLPIGTHVLQLVGVDAAGQLAVIEQTVRIEQPAPSPEPDRRAGAPPTLSPGASIATNAGVPEAVTIVPVPEVRQARVEGTGWTMAVDIPSADGRVAPAEGGGALIELVEEDFAEVSGDGFLPGTRADVWLFSTPTLLGTVTIGPDGSFTGLVPVTGIAIGEHTLQLQGVGRDGYVRAANLGVAVVPRASEEPAPQPEPEPELEATPEPAPERPADSVEVVTATGPEPSGGSPLVWIALLAAVLGSSGWWFLIGRRRRDDEDEAHQG